MKIKSLTIRSKDQKKLNELAHEYQHYCGFPVEVLPGMLIVAPRNKT